MFVSGRCPCNLLPLILGLQCLGLFEKGWIGPCVMTLGVPPDLVSGFLAQSVGTLSGEGHTGSGEALLHGDPARILWI